MTHEERREQVKGALLEAIKAALTLASAFVPYQPLSERIATAILALRDPDGQPMVLVRDLDQTPPATRVGYDVKRDKAGNPLSPASFVKVTEVPDAAEYRKIGFIKCLPEGK